MNRKLSIILYVVLAIIAIPAITANAATHGYQVHYLTYLDGSKVNYTYDDATMYEVDDGTDDHYHLDVWTSYYYTFNDRGEIVLEDTLHVYFYYKNGERINVEIYD